MVQLGVSDEQLATCVGCGLCLPHCPTYRVTGEERFSPRGRISVMRSIQLHGSPLDEEAVDSLASCIQCRGCEPACPSGVPYGRLIEATMSTIEADRRVRRNPWWWRPALRALGHHRLLLVGSRLLGVAQSVGLFRGKLPRIPLRVGRTPTSTATDPDVWIFTGCVMDAWSRPTHRSLARLVSASGATYAMSEGGCCGALHHHSGLDEDARRLARRIIASMPGSAPILVDSAGCGAAMKDYGHLLGDRVAVAFSARVLDAHEWLAERIHLIEPERPIERRSVIVQEPCHLRHVQKAHGAMRRVVQSVAEIVDTEDDGLCCGAGGAYAILEPGMAADVRRRKLDEIARVDDGRRLTVVSANPGCAQHLGAARVAVVHPLDLVAEAFFGRKQ